jgi:hypothetical protein
MVWETSQTMAGIPYGDCFSVETRWDFKPSRAKGSGVDVTVHVCVPFTKRCLFKVGGCLLLGLLWCSGMASGMHGARCLSLRCKMCMHH